MKVERIVTGKLEANCYVVSDEAGDAVIIDPGDDFEAIAERVDASGLRPHAILNTHAHPDHLGAAAAAVDAYGIPFHLHPEDEGLLSRTNFYRAFMHGEGPIEVPAVDVRLVDGMRLCFGSIEIEVLHTPGHTAGSVCFDSEGQLFTGDTLTADHLGRADLPGSDRDARDASVALLAGRFSPEATLRPGHGDPARFGDVVARLAEMPEAGR